MATQGTEQEEEQVEAIRVQDIKTLHMVVRGGQLRVQHSGEPWWMHLLVWLALKEFVLKLLKKHLAPECMFHAVPFKLAGSFGSIYSIALLQWNFDI